MTTKQNIIKGAIFTLLLFFFGLSLKAESQLDSLGLNQIKQLTANKPHLQKFIIKHQKNTKAVAVALAVALGPFAVHRLYLGTKPIVPVAYTVTLGGGLGFLPLADIIAILTTKDLGKYENNERIIMWINN